MNRYKVKVFNQKTVENVEYFNDLLVAFDSSRNKLNFLYRYFSRPNNSIKPFGFVD